MTTGVVINFVQPLNMWCMLLVGNYAFKKYKRNKACRYQATLCIMYCAVICFESHLFPKGYFLSVGVPYPEVMLPFIRDLYRKKPTQSRYEQKHAIT